MVATAFHDTAALLFDKTNVRPYRSLGSSRPPGPISVPDHLESCAIPTFFYHMDYLDHDRYPLGIADVVGYWAEHQKFQVVSFQSGNPNQSPVYAKPSPSSPPQEPTVYYFGVPLHRRCSPRFFISRQRVRRKILSGRIPHSQKFWPSNSCRNVVTGFLAEAVLEDQGT